ncbi:hypothetical protein ACRZ5S_19865 [Vibrio scophthalmi]|uniref:hypothetical protein n=1 Tax=Vibrio scophthalmi TaxID=45658 RepID=UPI003EBC2E0F
MIAIIVMIMIFLGFFTIISYNMLMVNHNLSVSSEMDSIDQELELIKKKLIKSAIPIINQNEFALPFGTAMSKEHRLPNDFGIALRNVRGHYYQYCPYGLNDGATKTETVHQNDGSSYAVSTTEIDGVDYATRSDLPPLNSGAPEVQAFIISKFEDSVVSCNDVKYDSDVGTFYLTNAKVKAITKDEIETYNSLNLSDTSLSLNVDNTTAPTIFTLLENDKSNRGYLLNITDNLTLTNDYVISKNGRTKVIINLNGNLLSNQTLELENVDLDVYSSSLRINTKATHFELNNSDIRFKNISFGGFTAKNSDVYLDNTFTNVYYANHINLLNSRMKLSDKLQFNVSNTFDAMFNLVGSELLINADIKERTATSKGYSIIQIDAGSSVHMNNGSLTLYNAMERGSNIVNVKGKFTTSNSGNTFAMTNTANVLNIINVDGGQLYLDSFKSNSTKHQGFTINQVKTNGEYHGSVLIRSTAGIEAGLSGCINRVKQAINGSNEIVFEQEVEAC